MDNNSLDDFLTWAYRHNHGGYMQRYVDNYRACIKERRERELEAAQAAVKDSD